MQPKLKQGLIMTEKKFTPHSAHGIITIWLITIIDFNTALKMNKKGGKWHPEKKHVKQTQPKTETEWTNKPTRTKKKSECHENKNDLFCRFNATKVNEKKLNTQTKINENK